jgi:hypothetical protein
MTAKLDLSVKFWLLTCIACSFFPRHAVVFLTSILLTKLCAQANVNHGLASKVFGPLAKCSSC